MKLSYSRLSVYLDCPLRFRRQYLGKYRLSESTDATEMGKAFHWAVEALATELKESGVKGLVKLDKERVKQLYMGVDLTETGPMPMKRFQDGLDVIQNMNIWLDPSKILEVEGEFDIPIPGTSHTFGGFIDRVDHVDEETVQIVDYKTGRILVEAVENDQLKLYAWALSKRYPHVKNWRLGIEMVRTGEASYWDFPSSRLEEVEEWLSYLAQRLEKEIEAWELEEKERAEAPADAAPTIPNHFKPSFTANCQWCPFSGECLQEFPMGEPQANCGNDINEMVSEYARLQQISKKAYKALKNLEPKIQGHVVKNDGFFFNTEFGRYEAKVERDFTLSDMVEVFKAQGRKISPFLKLDVYKLRAEAEKDTPLGKALRERSRPKLEIQQVRDKKGWS